MSEYRFVMEYVDTREVCIMADSLQEAQDKMDSGDWRPEDEFTIDFYANKLIKELHEA